MKFTTGLFVAGVLFLFSCAPATKITGSWKNPVPTTREYKTIFIATLSNNTIARSTTENDFADALNKYGIKTIKSIDEFPPAFLNDSVSKEVLLDKIKKKNSDGILTVSLLKKETESRYQRGGYPYAPVTVYPYYYNFSGYYSYWYPYTYSPGYYVNEYVYYFETNFYDGSTENLLWSAQSETYTYSGLSSVSKEFATVIVSKMAKEGVIHK
jgi:hypothetical protein